MWKDFSRVSENGGGRPRLKSFAFKAEGEGWVFKAEKGFNSRDLERGEFLRGWSRDLGGLIEPTHSLQCRLFAFYFPLYSMNGEWIHFALWRNIFENFGQIHLIFFTIFLFNLNQYISNFGKISSVRAPGLRVPPLTDGSRDRDFWTSPGVGQVILKKFQE